MRTCIAIVLVAALMGATVSADAPKKQVTRAFADGWGYMRLQTAVLEVQRDKITAELARLAEERKALEARAHDEFQLDFSAGDSFDERTLDIHRGKTP